MMGQSAEESRRRLRIAEHRGPFAEGEVRGDDDRSALVEPADQVEQELTTGLCERQIAKFIEDDEVEACVVTVGGSGNGGSTTIAANSTASCGAGRISLRCRAIVRQVERLLARNP